MIQRKDITHCYKFHVIYISLVGARSNGWPHSICTPQPAAKQSPKLCKISADGSQSLLWTGHCSADHPSRRQACRGYDLQDHNSYMYILISYIECKVCDQETMLTSIIESEKSSRLTFYTYIWISCKMLFCGIMKKISNSMKLCPIGYFVLQMTCESSWKRWAWYWMIGTQAWESRLSRFRPWSKKSMCSMSRISHLLVMPNVPCWSQESAWSILNIICICA